jgi:hypothetical protein
MQVPACLLLRAHAHHLQAQSPCQFDRNEKRREREWPKALFHQPRSDPRLRAWGDLVYEADDVMPANLPTDGEMKSCRERRSKIRASIFVRRLYNLKPRQDAATGEPEASGGTFSGRLRLC